MNKFIGLGNLVKDIDLRTTNSGKFVLNNTLAIKSDYKVDGEYQTEFVDFQVWGNQAEFVAKYLTKGDTLLIEGRLQKRSYETNGEKKYISEIICEKVKIIKKKEENRSMQDVRNDVFKDFGKEVVNKSELHEDENLPF